jgi:integrase
VGLRSIEAARLQLDDLDWRAGRSVLRGKASRKHGMPLPADVGEASSAYLRQARPDRRAARCSAAVPVRPSPLDGSPAASDTQVSTVAGAGNFNLSVRGSR